MGQYIDFYCGENNKELMKIVNSIIMKNFEWIPQKDFDDLYSIAAQVVWDCEKKFDSNKVKTKKFKSYLSYCILNKIKEYITYTNRSKRMRKDLNGNRIQNVSLDSLASIGEEKRTIQDTIQSDFDVYNIYEKRNGLDYDEKVERFLNTLSKTQRQILEMKMNGESIVQIKEKLELTDNEYQNHMILIKQNPVISIFNKGSKVKQQYKKEGTSMKKDYKTESKNINIMDIDTSDNYREDKCTLFSLLEDFGDEFSPNYIDRTYISQREPFQWNDEQINKYFSRILNNQPIPEIVICEKKDDKEKKSYLIDGLQRLTYAEEFRENRMPVKAKGAEFINIKYKKKIKDDFGEVRTVEDVFNIAGKYYKDLPEFLQKRFDKFNIKVTRFFNCTDEMIDYHMRNYNNHVAMSKSQYGITNVDKVTATNIKEISKNHSFFKNNIKCSAKNRKSGALEEVVARAMMVRYFINDWKREVIDVYKYVDKNATDEQYLCLKNNLDALSKVADKSVQELFTLPNTPIWLCVYDNFRQLYLNDDIFIDFMRYFKEILHSEDENETKVIYKNKNTKDKRVIVDKIDKLNTIMYEYLHIVTNDLQEDIPTLEFVKEKVKENADEEDLALYEDMLNDYIYCNSPIYKDDNLPSLLAIVGYGVENNKDDEVKEWFKYYSEKENTYSKYQRINYKHMIDDLEQFIARKAVA